MPNDNQPPAQPNQSSATFVVARDAYSVADHPDRPLWRQWWFWLAFGGSAVVLVAVLLRPTMALSWKTDWSSAFLDTLGALAVVALFVERVIEVFVNIWQNPQADVLEQQLEFEQAIQVHREAEIARLTARLTDAALSEQDREAIRNTIRSREQERSDSERAAEGLERQLVRFRAATRRIATWTGILVGVLTAGVGFRMLAGLVDVSALLKNERQWQYHWFVAADVLLTGAVLAGGSKAVHQIFNLFDTVMATSQSIAQKRKLQRATAPVPPADATNG